MLYDNIRKLRLERGMSQEELAEKLYVVRQTVSKWEKGLSVPDADMLVKLSEVLGVSVSELLGEGNADNFCSDQSKRENILKVIIRIILGVLICYFVFMIIQVIFGFCVSVNTDTSENVVSIATIYEKASKFC